MTKKHDLLFAKQDKPTGLAGLFKTIDRRKKRPILDETWQPTEDSSINFFGREVLTATDLRVLLGIIATAGPKGSIIEHHAPTQRQLALVEPDCNQDFNRDKRELKIFREPTETIEEYEHRLRGIIEQQLRPQNGQYDVGKENIVVRQKQSDLLQIVGISDAGENYEALRNSLRRMASITITTRVGKKETATHLLGYGFDEETNDLYISLNWHTTQAIMGDMAYSRIEMREVRAINSDIGLILHNRLCGFVDPGKKRTIRFETLYGYIYDPSDEITKQTKSKRRNAVRTAFEKMIAETGWEAQEIGSDTYEISRAKAKRSTVATEQKDP
jgi:hypothetical protein